MSLKKSTGSGAFAVPSFIRDVHGRWKSVLQQQQRHRGGVWVRVMGIVVSAVVGGNHAANPRGEDALPPMVDVVRQVRIDDGSGVLCVSVDVVADRQASVPSVGDLVDVVCELRLQQDDGAVWGIASAFKVEEDTTVETLRWLEVMDLHMHQHKWPTRRTNSSLNKRTNRTTTTTRTESKSAAAAAKKHKAAAPAAVASGGSVTSASVFDCLQQARSTGLTTAQLATKLKTTAEIVHTLMQTELDGLIYQNKGMFFPL